MIGGASVSVYNAASVVSKMMAIISVPVRNVLLSYIVDVDKINVVKQKKRKIIALVALATLLIYGAFYLAGVIFCRLLYPQYYDSAVAYIPVILLAILFETYSGFIKVYLLRFEKTVLQVITSCIKIAAYAIGIVVLVWALDMGLAGFCFAILIADTIQLLISVVYFIKNLRGQFRAQSTDAQATEQKN
jgi:O-antigen/teichoic acid export membrane protein